MLKYCLLQERKDTFFIFNFHPHIWQKKTAYEIAKARADIRHKVILPAVTDWPALCCWPFIPTLHQITGTLIGTTSMLCDRRWVSKKGLQQSWQINIHALIKIKGGQKECYGTLLLKGLCGNTILPFVSWESPYPRSVPRGSPRALWTSSKHNNQGHSMSKKLIY